MGVGQYNTNLFPVPSQQGPIAPPPPAFNFAGGYNTPTGVSANPFDQSAINWMYAQNYGKERVGQNQDFYEDYQLKMNNWALNGQRGPMPTPPAYFETDPNKLYNYFNSGQEGILTTNGVMPSGVGQRDPFSQMYYLGNPSNPLNNGSYVYGSEGWNPAYPNPNQPTPGSGFSMTPEQIAWASTNPWATGQPPPPPTTPGIDYNPNAYAPRSSGRSQVDQYDPRTQSLMSQNTGLADFGANLSPETILRNFFTGPFQQGDPRATMSSQSLGTQQPTTPAPLSLNGGIPSMFFPQGSGGAANFPFSNFNNNGMGSYNAASVNTPQGTTAAPAAFSPSANDTFLSGLSEYLTNLNSFAQKPQQANLNTPAMEWLTSVINQGGNPIDQTPAWQAMIDAQQNNINRQAGNLNEYFNTMGGRFSTSYGNAMNDFYNQTSKDQNALLAAAQTQAAESAQQRMMNAGQLRAGFDIQSQTDALQRQAQLMGQLGQLGFQGPALQSQLENQRFLQSRDITSQEAMQGRNITAQQGLQSQSLAAQAAMQQAALQNALEQQSRGFGFGASMYNAQAADQAANQLAQNSMFGANQLLNNSVLGAQMLFGNQNQGAGALFGNQNAGLNQALQQYMQGQGMNLGAAGNLQQLIGQNIGQGLNISGQQQSTLQDQINRQYQEWIRTQPQYNPLMQMLAGLSSQQSGMFFPQFQPSLFQQIMGGLGGGGGIANILKLFGVG